MYPVIELFLESIEKEDFVLSIFEFVSNSNFNNSVLSLFMDPPCYVVYANL